MYDNFHISPWSSTWYAACGIPVDRVWSLPVTTEATNNAGQFTLKDCTAKGKTVKYQKMHDDCHTLPWKATWYAACGIPKDGAWSLPITTQATNNSGQCLPSRGKASSTSEMCDNLYTSPWQAAWLRSCHSERGSVGSTNHYRSDTVEDLPLEAQLYHVEAGLSPADEPQQITAPQYPKAYEVLQQHDDVSGDDAHLYVTKLAFLGVQLDTS